MIKTPKNCCRECHSPLPAAGAGSNMRPQDRRRMIFCTTACKAKWNNRNKLRGADLVQLMLCHRYERALSAQLGLFKAICRLVQTWQEEDERAGRQTYERPEKLLLRLMDDGRLKRGDVLTRNAAGVERAA